MLPRGAAKKKSGTVVQHENELRGEARLVVPGRLMGMNELLEAKANVGEFHRKKKQEMQRIALHARAQRFPYVRRAMFVYWFYEPNARRDRINIIGGGVKVMEDALVNAGLLEGDGQRNVLAIVPHVEVDSENPRVELVVLEVKEGEKDGILRKEEAKA